MRGRQSYTDREKKRDRETEKHGRIISTAELVACDRAGAVMRKLPGTRQKMRYRPTDRRTIGQT